MNRIIKIVDGFPAVVVDHWHVIRDAEAAESDLIHASHRLIPLSHWHAFKEQKTHLPFAIAPWISSGEDFECLFEDIDEVPLIAVDFPSFRDGRGYSVAYLLRRRFNFRGELRAIGEVLRDQLKHMRQCGFDAFDVRSDKDIHQEILGLKDFSVRYQGTATEALPLFRRRL